LPPSILDRQCLPLVSRHPQRRRRLRTPLFFFLPLRPPPTSSLFPYTTLFRSPGTAVSFLAGDGSSLTSVPPSGSLAGIQGRPLRSEEHTSELRSRGHLVCRLLLEKKNRSVARDCR